MPPDDLLVIIGITVILCLLLSYAYATMLTILGLSTVSVMPATLFFYMGSLVYAVEWWIGGRWH